MFLQIFYKAVITCFTNAVSNNEALLAKFTSTAHTALAFDPEAIPARKRYLSRQVKLVTNLIKWRRCTGELFGVGQLISRVADGCVLHIADSGWDVGGEEALKKVGWIACHFVTHTHHSLPDCWHASSRVDNVKD